MTKQCFCGVFLVMGLWIAQGVAADDLIEAQVFTGDHGATLPYRMLKPTDLDPKQTYPLVVCLHGARGRGTDNRSRGSEAFAVLSTPENRAQFPAFVITPQCPTGKKWVDSPWKNGSYSTTAIPMTEPLARVLDIIEALRKEFPIDPARIYVTGQSMGGYGTWDLLVRAPDVFAAGVPACGAGDPSQAARIAHIPIWNFHGADDDVVPVQASRDMYAALTQVGGNIKYTEYPGVGHNSYKVAWRTETELLPWLFAQRKK